MNQSVMESHTAPPFFQGEKWLVYTGMLGFLLAAICAIWVMLHGGPVAPNGDVSKAFSFNAALGIFLLSTAAIIPLSALGTRSRAFFRWSYILLALYSYGAETVQNFRGVDPRFVKNGTPFDVAVGSIFTFVALLLVLFYVFIAIQFFRRKAYSLHPELAVGIRYAMIAIMLSFAAGLWISFNDGRVVGQQGNIIWLHGIGFHALQAVPFVAWLAERKKHVSTGRTGFIHLTGIAYLLGLAAIGWQTYLGRAVMEMSVLPILAACCFLVAFIPIVYFLLQKNDAKKLHNTSDIPN
ncbi:hypothetical protein FB479_102860 [Brevibacillus sp. AG162]|uniref:hypothetical protein n=1 Tax=Brevibacillus sp. AG162 TaxID=2572910 RepID=UPI00115175D4|nr:hypothetical protein [Brevibacillus sp. AG162]TQK74217.1 hypothetical protein FB479_102860 [Brevibacillus sp. AG162]